MQRKDESSLTLETVTLPVPRRSALSAMPQWSSTLEWTHPGWLLALAGAALLALGCRRFLLPAVGAGSIKRLAAQVIVVTLLAGALAAPCYRFATPQRMVVLVVDRSESIRGAQQDRAEKFIERTIQLRGNHWVAVLPFAGRAGELEFAGSIVTDPGAAGQTDSKSDHRREKPGGSPAESVDLDRLASNPARAVLVAAAQIAPDYVPQIVLLSDGAQTDGDLQKAAAGAGVPISVVPLAPLAGPEVCLSELTTPAYAAPHDDFEVDVVIESNQADSGVLALRCDDRPIAERRVEVTAGRNVVPLRAIMPGTPRAVVVAELRDFHDTTAENNRRSAIVYAANRPRVLIVASAAPAAARFAAALDGQGFETSAATPSGFDHEPDLLNRCGVLVLLDVAMAQLSETAQQSIARFARAGGGVLGIGGAATFATAAYRHTVLEEVLPVSALPQADARQASVALVLVIDKSGSMGDEERLELAKQAATRVVGLLTPQDQLGVLAFATDSSWLTPMAPDTNRPELEERIAALRAGGGTNMYPAMQKAALALGEAIADHKQMILLTDGISAPGDFQILAGSLAREQIAVSTVSIGGEADQELLQKIAEITRGRHYHCENPADIPRVVVEEAKLAVAATASHSRPLVLHQLPRLNAADTPPLADAVATTAKSAAEVLLLSASGDPLLSWWRFGSGVTLAYTANVALPELGAPQSQDREAQFWARVVRQALGRPGTNPWDIHLVRSGRQARLTAEGIRTDGAFLSGARARVTMTGPGGRRPLAELPLVAPGRYQADFELDALPTDEVLTNPPGSAAALRGPGSKMGTSPSPRQFRQGVYEFELRLDGPSAEYVQRRALVQDYADELQLAAPNESLLREVAMLSGGIYNPQVEELLAADGRTAARRLPLWPYFVLAAVVMSVLDAVWRRVDARGTY